MADLKPTTDPYRVLDILRGATQRQIKTAHRRLAKRYHPDGSTGDEQRFLAVQAAYQLLSDPLRRSEWDRRHAPGPVRAASSSRPGQPRRPGRRRSASTTSRGRGTPRTARPQPAPGQRRTTCSAEHVPWWEDFDPRAPRRKAASGDSSTATGQASGGPAQGRSSMDFDVFDRSSGAAWSAAARQHFRRGTDDLPSRGVWRYRGTQVVTGAEARKVADEDVTDEDGEENETS